MIARKTLLGLFVTLGDYQKNGKIIYKKFRDKYANRRCKP